MASIDRRTQSKKPIPWAAAGVVCLAFTAVPAILAQSYDQPRVQPQYTIRARVPLTIVDIVVTDAKGHPIHGLKQSDFTILEDNQPMSPTSFDEHRSDEPPSAPAPLNQPMPPNTFTNVVPIPTGRPINLLLIDSLNTPSAMQVQVRRQVLDYIKKMPPGTRIAIFGLTTHLFLIQGFTSDPKVLEAALTDSDKLMPMIPPMEDLQQEPPGIDPPKTLEEQGNDMAVRGQITFAAISQIARYLGGLPGRKNLIWSSAAFPLQFPPDPRDPGAWPPGFPQVFDFTQNVRSMGDMLARAHIAVYPIEPRGIDKIIKPGNRKSQVEFSEHGSMDMVADLTGGTNFHNTNGITEAITSAIDAGSNFYTLTYTPQNQKLDSRFRTINVKVSRPSLHLTYRNGYFAIDPATTLTGKSIDKIPPMQSALMRGALQPTQILFKVRIAQSPTSATASPDNQPDTKFLHPPYRHYNISYVIDVHGIEFNPSPDGNYRGDFEYGIRVYNAEGDEVLNSVSKIVNPILPAVVYRSMLASGANAHQQIDLPATGVYVLRIAVHDLASDHVGAVEVPISSIAGKQP